MRRRSTRSCSAVLSVLVGLASLSLVERSSATPAGDAAAKRKVAAPRFVRQIATGETGWFSSPGLVDLDGDRRLEIVAPFYSTFVYSAKGRLLGKGTATKGRVYAPAVVADLDRDRVPEIVVGGNEGPVAAYDLVGGQVRVKPGWPASTCSGGQCPEARGMAAADLDGDGRIEVVVTTTNTSPTGAQVFVFDASGASYRPAGAPATAWPRFNTLPGAGNDAGFNGVGNHGYGAYGENVGIGNLDDDPQLEVVVTFDNHQINVFNHDGTSVLASPWYTNRESGHDGARLGWGQFIRWLRPRVEDNHYHPHDAPRSGARTGASRGRCQRAGRRRAVAGALSARSRGRSVAVAGAGRGHGRAAGSGGSSASGRRPRAGARWSAASRRSSARTRSIGRRGLAFRAHSLTETDYRHEKLNRVTAAASTSSRA